MAGSALQKSRRMATTVAARVHNRPGFSCSTSATGGRRYRVSTEQADGFEDFKRFQAISTFGPGGSIVIGRGRSNAKRSNGTPACGRLRRIAVARPRGGAGRDVRPTVRVFWSCEKSPAVAWLRSRLCVHRAGTARLCLVGASPHRVPVLTGFYRHLSLSRQGRRRYEALPGDQKQAHARAAERDAQNGPQARPGRGQPSPLAVVYQGAIRPLRGYTATH
jgi:hypothetical protein